MEGKWLSILEYANYKNKSISTVRRYIKANRVKFKDENGKYYIFCKNYQAEESDRATTELKLENIRLQKENRVLLEELSELRMLISLYEKGQMLPQHSKSDSLPSIPTNL